jgi:hypothetical protein
MHQERTIGCSASRVFGLTATLGFLLMALSVEVPGADLSAGVAYALPTVNGKAPQIDGDLADWDWSAAEPCWIGLSTVKERNAEVAYLFDGDALYIGARVALPGRPLENRARPIDRFWQGDLLQLRLASDPALPFPLPNPDGLKGNKRVMHISLWKNTEMSEDYIHLAFGARFDGGSAVNPPGSALKINPTATGYTLEARIPWAALNVPDGRLPFTPGQRMTAIMEVLWGGGDASRTVIHCHRDPGVFAFHSPGAWGQIEFSPTGARKPRHGGLAAVIRQSAQTKPPTGTPIRFEIAQPGKVTVNILDADGGVVRELMGGEWHEAGPVTAWWDGRNQWGEPMPLGDYRWGVYVSPGLDVEYVGTVGTSGNPPYETLDGKGGWGGDHGWPIDVAADATGWYFLWSMNESGRTIVKTDFAGNVVWRSMPFVLGGYGGFTSMAANGTRVFLAGNRKKAEYKFKRQLVQLDAATGRFLPFPDGQNARELPVADEAPRLARSFSPMEPQVVAGAACDTQTLYLSDFPGNRILVLDPETGTVRRELACPGPRGICLSGTMLYAACFDPLAGRGSVQRLDLAAAAPAVECVVADGLDAPWDLAVDEAGRMHVTDLGHSQQVRVFAADGKPLRHIGKPAGRPYLGTYVPANFLNPAGIAWDGRGGVLLAEAATPKVFTRLDAESGKALRKWYGYTAYSPTNIPDSDDPFLQYYSLSGPESFARARLPKGETKGLPPQASWDFPGAGIAEFGAIMDTMTVPEVVAATNGRKYLVSDAESRTICLIEGDDMLPVASANVGRDPKKKGNWLEFWMDTNGDHRVQPDEVRRLETVEERRVDWAHLCGSQYMAPNGDLFLTADNAVILLPCAGFARDGSIRWDTNRARFAIPKVLDRVERLGTGWREGVLGVRRDSQGNLYVIFSTVAPYATRDLTKAMNRGMGHTSTFNTVKFAKFAADGRLLWLAGRKATASPKPGEIMHHWIIGGLIDDRYIVGCSEWGTFAVYSADGFYVDTLFDLPGKPGRGIPYTFGGEDFSGQVRYYAKRDEVWAFNAGHTYRVKGFRKGRVIGEKRLSGKVALARVEPIEAGDETLQPLKAVALAGDARSDAAWTAVPVMTLKADGRDLAQFQIGYTTTDLFFRARVNDGSPLVNKAESLNAIFKGGDGVGIELGPLAARDRREPLVGMTRFLVAAIGGQTRLVALKPVTGLVQKPESFFTPAGKTAAFQFLGEVPDGEAVLTPLADKKGYTCLARIPLAFLELELKPGVRFAAEAEVLLSGQGPRGTETVARHYLFSPASPATTMVNDTPTEARLYPAGWGTLEVE